MKFECQACLGVYISPQRDGQAYYHACPPLTDHASGVQTRRADHRDETVVQPDPLLPARIKSEGAGRRALLEA